MININSGWFSGALLLWVAGLLVFALAISLRLYDRRDRRAWVLLLPAVGLFAMSGYLVSHAVTW